LLKFSFLPPTKKNFAGNLVDSRAFPSPLFFSLDFYAMRVRRWDGLSVEQCVPPPPMQVDFFPPGRPIQSLFLPDPILSGTRFFHAGFFSPSGINSSLDDPALSVKSFFFPDLPFPPRLTVDFLVSHLLFALSLLGAPGSDPFTLPPEMTEWSSFLSRFFCPVSGLDCPSLFRQKLSSHPTPRKAPPLVPTFSLIPPIPGLSPPRGPLGPPSLSFFCGTSPFLPENRVFLPSL